MIILFSELGEPSHTPGALDISRPRSDPRAVASIAFAPRKPRLYRGAQNSLNHRLTAHDRRLSRVLPVVSQQQGEGGHARA